MLLPGSVLPAQLAYADLLALLPPEVDAVAKELELYREDVPPTDYSLDTEVDGVLREAEARGWKRFHLVGYSAGGAASLAVTAAHPEMLLSLSLLEPAWAGDWDWSAEHGVAWSEFLALDGLPHEQLMAQFARLQVAPDVELTPPPPGPPPPWMSRRPAGIRALLRAFTTYRLDRDRLSAFAQPVYFALGGRSNDVWFGDIARRLAAVLPDFTLEVYADRHHFDPPHRIEPERVSRSLSALWRRAKVC